MAFKLNPFSRPELSCEERRNEGYRDAAATLLRTGDQRAVEDMAMGFDSYAHGAGDALYDYRQRRLAVIDECRKSLLKLETL